MPQQVLVRNHFPAGPEQSNPKGRSHQREQHGAPHAGAQVGEDVRTGTGPRDGVPNERLHGHGLARLTIRGGFLNYFGQHPAQSFLLRGIRLKLKKGEQDD